jgi:hypothetical protein
VVNTKALLQSRGCSGGCSSSVVSAPSRASVMVSPARIWATCCHLANVTDGHPGEVRDEQRRRRVLLDRVQHAQTGELGHRRLGEVVTKAESIKRAKVA